MHLNTKRFVFESKTPKHKCKRAAERPDGRQQHEMYLCVWASETMTLVMTTLHTGTSLTTLMMITAGNLQKIWETLYYHISSSLLTWTRSTRLADQILILMNLTFIVSCFSIWPSKPQLSEIWTRAGWRSTSSWSCPWWTWRGTISGWPKRASLTRRRSRPCPRQYKH